MFMPPLSERGMYKQLHLFIIHGSGSYYFVLHLTSKCVTSIQDTLQKCTFMHKVVYLDIFTTIKSVLAELWLLHW